MKSLPVSEALPSDIKVLNEHIRKIEKYIKSEKESLKFPDELAYKKLSLILDYYEELRMYERAATFEKAYKVAEIIISLENQKQ